MSEPQINPTLFYERVIKRFHLVEKVLTYSPLGIHDQLKGMPEIIGCDCVLLASSVHSMDGMGSAKSEWRMRRVYPIKYEAVITDNINHEDADLSQLTKKLEELVKSAQEESQKLFFFNDWGSQNKKSKAWYDQMPERLKHEFKLSMEPPVEIYNGITKYLITHVGLVLLGSVSIGKWELGESYLVFLDIDEPGNSPTPDEWVSTVREDCFPFLAYLGEVNAHFNRLLQLNQHHPIERLHRIEKMTDVECEAYCRSATRLTPLLDNDLPATIETLVQMNAVLDHKTIHEGKTVAVIREMEDTATAVPGGLEPAPIRPSVAEVEVAGTPGMIKIKAPRSMIEDAFDGFTLKSHPVLEDSRRIIPEDEIERRRKHVRRQIEWTRIWWDLEQLHHQSQHHRDDSYRAWSSKLSVLLGQMKVLFANSPAEAWFHLGVDKDGLLMLSGPCLAGFLVTQVIAHSTDLIDPDKLKLSGFSDARGREVLTFTRNLVCVIRYALGCIPPDQGVLQAQLWLLSEIGHTRFDVDRRLDFEKHLYLAAMEQPALYGLKAFYRDHLNHVIQVCLTGWLLLEAEFMDANNQPSQVADVFLSQGQEFEKLMEQWFVASLLHDVGYVIDIGTGWADLLEKFEDKEVLGNLSNRTRKMIEKWGSHIDQWKEWGYKKDDLPGEDHGVVSALHVQSALAEITKPSAADYSTALTAIAHHNHLKAKIRFKKERLSVLLVLCDELQEWDRPWLELDRAALALSTVVAFNPAHALQWHKPLSKVTTNLRLESTPDNRARPKIKMAGAILEFSINYSTDIHRNHSIFNAWLGRSRSLERINLGDTDECPLDFHFRMINPVATPSALFDRDPSEPELTRLGRIVREQRIWSIYRWLKKASNNITPPPVGNGPAEQAVYYENDNKTNSETVMLDVRLLKSESLISGDLAEFWKKLARWPYAHESMDES